MSLNFKATDAAGYEQVMGRWSRLLAVPFIDFAEVDANQRVLDVGCGTGSLSAVLATRLEGGDVVGIDVAEPYVAYAAAAIGDPRFRFEVGDATALKFADRSFDRVLALLVMPFVPDARRATAEMARVTRAGGIVAATMWNFEGGLVSVRMFWDTAAMLDPAAAAQRGRIFSAPCTRHGEIAAVFRDAGLADIAERDVTLWFRFASFADYWSPFLAGQGTAGVYCAGLAPAQRQRLEAALREAYLAGRPDGPRAFTATAHLVKGRVTG